MNNWYAIQVISGKELDIKESIFNIGFKALAPRRRMIEQVKGSWKHVIRLLLPGYVFINADMQDAGSYYKVTGIPGVINILRGASSSPTPISQEEMEQCIFRLMLNDDMVEISDVFTDGEQIKIINGPLTGYEGQIVKIDKRRFRAKVKFSMYGKDHIIELGVNVINKID